MSHNADDKKTSAVLKVFIYGALFVILFGAIAAFCLSINNGLDCPDKDSPSNDATS